MVSRSGVRWLALALALLGCESAPSRLVVDVRTDFVPRVEFDEIRTEIRDGASAGTRVDHRVDLRSNYVGGARVAELGAIEERTITVEVGLLRRGEVVLSRPVSVALVPGANAMTVLMTGGCVGVECEAGLACLDGECVDEGCTESTPELCGALECRPSDCISAAACSVAECTPSGVCFAAPDHASCGEEAYCEPTFGCVPFAHDLAAGLAANLVPGAGSATAADQVGGGGWFYHYLPETRFGRYGPLDARDTDPASWMLMESAVDDVGAVGWRTLNTSIPMAPRGQVSVFNWEAGGASASGDAVGLSPENAVQPVIEWRAPAAGTALVDLELRGRRGAPESDVEVHLFAIVDGAPDELGAVYVSDGGAPDANGRPTGPATSTMPARLSGTVDVDAGDGIYLMARIGDDDAFDFVAVRGSIFFAPRR